MATWRNSEIAKTGLFLLFLFFAHAAFPMGNNGKGFSSSSHGFIENKGQIIDQNYQPNPDVLYLLNTPGMNVQLRKGGFSYDLYEVKADTGFTAKSPRHKEDLAASRLSSEKGSATKEYNEIKFYRIDFDLVNSDPDCEIIRGGESSDYSNYYTVGTTIGGVTSVKSYKSIIYKNIYPNIDLEFQSDDGVGFKYNFIINSGGNINALRIKISCPDINLNPDGSLIINTSFGSIKEDLPKSYFDIDHQENAVSVKFRRIGDHLFGFSLEEKAVDGATLIIDPRPVRIWSTYYGGSNMEIIYSCWFDSAQNVYITGWTGSSDNIATAGSFQSYYAGNYDAFVAKFDPDGQRLWGTYFGGSNNEDWTWSAIDLYGNVYMTGHTNSTTNIATPGAYQINRIGPYDAFLVKFNANGFRCWGTYYGGMGYTSGFFCSVDDSCRVYFGGETSVASGIASPGAYQTSLSGVYDGFLAKFDSSGQRLWATYYGGSNYDQARQCSVKNSVVFLSGETQSNDGIATMGSFQTSYGGVMDCWLAKFTTSGQLQWGTYYGGSLADRAGVCVADSNENVFLSGYTSSPDNIATPGSFQVLSGGNTDGFLAKFNSAGQRLWGTYYGGAGADIVWGCSADDSMHVYIFGQTSSGSDIASPDGYQTSYGGSSSDAFLTKFTNNGERVWGTYYGDTGMDFGYGCSVDPCGHIYFAGYTTSENNITTPGSFQSNYAGNTDGFLVKFADCNGADSAKAITGPGDICQNTNGLSFTVPIIAHATGYNWTVPPGFSISGGGNTNSITVNISGNVISGNISVYGTNCCQNGAPSSLYVTVHSRPIPDISGNDTICQGASSTYYTESGKSQYQWTVSSGGTITGGGMESDTSVTVLWSIPGSQWVSLNYTDTNDCAGLDPTVKNIEILNGIPVNVTITESSNNICLGTPVTFTATPFNGGTTPTYQWKVNSVNAGTDTPVFTYSPTNGDMVQCILTSSNPVCTSNNPASSNTIAMIVSPNLAVSVSVSPTTNPVCTGTSVTFNASASNGGTTPSYQWKVNGTPVGANQPTYAYIPLNDDGVTCTVLSNAACALNNPATSPVVTMTVNPNLPVSISIISSSNPFCEGSSVTFTATPNNGGTSPSYQWKVNGTNVGTNSSAYTYLPAPNDSIRCVMTSSVPCPVINPVSSGTITMQVASQPAVTFTACFDTITTVNAKPFRLKGGIPIGGTYSGPGITPENGIFNPAVAGTGLKTITYTYTNAALCSDARSSIINVRSAVPFTCGNNLTDIRDNQHYPTVQIGSQCWMAANLNYGTMISSSSHQRDNCLNEKYCYQDLSANCNVQGANYQWDEVMRFEDIAGQQGLCPPGWHVPTETDWNQLFANWTSNGFAAAPLKYSGYSGFNASLNGAVFFNRDWYFEDFATFFWSSTSHGLYKAWAHGMNDYDPSVSLYPALRSNAFSVRCLWD